METIKHNLKLSEMLNHRIEDNGVNKTGTLQGESVAPGRHGVPDPAPVGRHQATGRTNQRMKWEKEVNKIVIGTEQNGEKQEVELLEEREGNWVFPDDDEIMVGRAEIERYDEEEKELLRKVLNEIRQNPEKIPPNLRFNDRKNVKAATMKVNKVMALIRTESITETNSVTSSR